MSRNKELMKNTFIIFLGKISNQFLSFFLVPVYTAFLSPNEYGYVDLLVTYITFLIPIVSLQLHKGEFRFLVDCREDNEEIHNIFATTLFSTCVLIFICIILSLLINTIVSFKFMYYMPICIVSAVFNNVFLQLARGIGKNSIYSIGSILNGVITLLCNILFITVFHVGGKGILLSYIIGNTSCGIILFFLLKSYRYLKYGLKIDFTCLKELINYSLPLIPNEISWWMINVFDRTLISFFLGATANGIYVAANKVSSIIIAVFSVLEMAWTESASMHIDDVDRDYFLNDVMNNILRLFSSFALFLIAVMPFAFKIIIRGNFGDSYNYISILILAAYLLCFGNTYNAIYTAVKNTKKIATTSMFAGLLTIIINIWLLNKYGIIVVVLSKIIANILVLIFRHYDISKIININFQKIFILSLFLMFFVVISTYYSHNSLLQLIILIITIIYSFILNKKFIISFCKILLNKIKIIKY